MVSVSPTVIFAAFCMGVPIFMAFNGGATQATIDTIQETGHWSPSGIGLLGAMDKIGMTVSAAFWGYMLQHASAKTLLVIGLGINGASCLLFGILENCYSMYLAKLLIGFTEGLQWVWAPLWIGQWAEARSLSSWMNLSGGVAAGAGNGLGTIVAGFSTASGLSYAFAFRIEAGALIVLWIGLVLVDAELLEIRRREEERPMLDKLKSATSNLTRQGSFVETMESRALTTHFTSMIWFQDSDILGEQVAKQPIMQQLLELWKNRLFVWAALAFSCSNFVNSGMQFMWIRLFMALWSESKNVAVISLLIISGGGGAVGMLMSSWHEPVSDAAGRRQTIAFILKAFFCALIGAVLTLVACDWQLVESTAPDYRVLGLAWIGIFMAFAGVAGTPGLLQILCINSVEDEHLRSFGTGLYQGVNNFLGFALGPLVPQVVMEIAIKKHVDETAALVAGLATIFTGIILAIFYSCRAQCAAAIEDDDEKSASDDSSAESDGEGSPRETPRRR